MLKRLALSVVMGVVLVPWGCLDVKADDPHSAAKQCPPYIPNKAIKPFLDDLSQYGNPLNSMTTQSVPRLWLNLETSASSWKEISLKSVRDVGIPARNRQIPVRLYTPSDRRLASDEGLPILIYVHGGGWALGSIGTYDNVARGLANKIPAIVVSVDYRLAPEHPFPAGLDDVHLAVHWTARNADQIGGDKNRIAIAGDSGGATIATVVTRKMSKQPPPIVFQALFYPSTNISSVDTQSYREYGEGYYLTKKAVEAFRCFYVLNRADWDSPEVSPLLASDDDLKLMPPTLIVTAGCDPLREEGKAYADRLKACGVSVTYRLEEDMIHAYLGFFNSPRYQDFSTVVEERLDPAVAVIREGLRVKKDGGRE
jgi:acetyl esterase